MNTLKFIAVLGAVAVLPLAGVHAQYAVDDQANTTINAGEAGNVAGGATANEDVNGDYNATQINGGVTFEKEVSDQPNQVIEVSTTDENEPAAPSYEEEAEDDASGGILVKKEDYNK